MTLRTLAPARLQLSFSGIPVFSMRLGLAVLVLLLLLSGAARAQGAPAPLAVPGAVRDIALSGEAVVVASTPKGPAGRTLLVERRVPGSPPTVLLRTRLEDDDDHVSVAASAEAAAVSLAADDGAARVLIGPAAGPLREVARCETALLPLAIAVDGPRILWGEGGCGVPPRRPRESGPAAFAEGAVDPTAPVSRVALEESTLAGPIATGAGRTVAGILRPTFFGLVRAEVRELARDGTGAVLAREPSGFLAPVGVLPDGSPLLVGQSFEELDGERDERCVSRVVVVPPAGGERRRVPLGGCPEPDFSEEDTLPGRLVAVAGDRVIAITHDEQRRRGPARAALVSTAPSGADRRILSRGSYRSPLGLDAEGPRVAWWQPRCAGGAEIVTGAAVPAARTARGLAACRAELLTRRPRLRGRRIVVRLRCPRGCKGRVVDETSCLNQRSRTFAFGRGTHRVSLGLSARTRRRGRLRLAVRVENGPSDARVVRLRR